MKLQELLKGIEVLECRAEPCMDVTGVSFDSRAVKQGELFVAVTGFAADGHKFIPAAVKNGAAAVLCERDRDAAAVIERNISALRLGRDRARLVRGDVLKRGAAAPGRPFDLVFLDPPYATDPAQIFGLLGRLGDAGALARDLIVSYEHDASDDDAVEALAETSRYEIASRRHFGDTTLDLLERLCTE